MAVCLDLIEFFRVESYIQAMNGFFLYLKLFKYSSKLSRKFEFFAQILQESAKTFLPFCMILCVCFGAFGISGFLMFGSDLDSFRSFSYSILTMFRYTVSTVDYDSINLSSRIYGSVYYYIWSILIFLILVNVFIEIISQAYALVYDKIENQNHGVRTTNKKKHLFGFFRHKSIEKVSHVVKGFGSVVRHADVHIDRDGQLTDTQLCIKYAMDPQTAKELITKVRFNFALMF